MSRTQLQTAGCSFSIHNQINKCCYHKIYVTMSGDPDHQQLNNEICTQEILIEAEDGEQYLVNLGGEECYENQVSNYEVGLNESVFKKVQ